MRRRAESVLRCSVGERVIKEPIERLDTKDAVHSVIYPFLRDLTKINKNERERGKKKST